MQMKCLLRRAGLLFGIILSLVLAMPPRADAAEANLGVTLGNGLTASSSFSVNQENMDETALALVRQYRQDALTDTAVTISGMTVADYLAANSISQETYLNPTWSNALERIAIQRAAESTVLFSHTRPGGSICFTATYQGVSSNSEIIAGTSDIDYSMSLWAAEKDAYVNQTPNAETGHYFALINPSYRSYGFASVGTTCVGESSYITADDQSATDLSGTFDISLSLPDEALADANFTLNVDSIDLNKPQQLLVSFVARAYGRAFTTTTGSWSSSDAAIASINESGVASGLNRGAVTITFAVELSDGSTISQDFDLLVGALTMHRFYNRWTGEHLYTSDATECTALVDQGWTAEGVGWIAPTKSETPVYRLYNPYVEGGDHHYTTDEHEYEELQTLGWEGEGIGWYSDDTEGVALYRLYNPYAATGTHHYTTDAHERDVLVDEGWRDENIAWYGMAL